MSTIKKDPEDDSDDMFNKYQASKKKKIPKQAEKEDDNLSIPIKRGPSLIPSTEKKKVKKELKPSQRATPKKQKGPLDLDKQCGVLIPPLNIQCARSITCKIHSMGAKRSVQGRSQPYNELLACYQKKTVTKNDQIMGKKENTKTKVSVDGLKGHVPMTIHSINHLPNKYPHHDEDIDMDSDEETESVRLAFEQYRPMPLGEKEYFYVRRRRKCFKLRDMLLETLTPKVPQDSNSGRLSISSSIMPGIIQSPLDHTITYY
ncbi:SCA7, zinc-binding domain-containing protein [Pilobolus umbonatus]|nr:SCA7, zinc-binding domain-containing protein [Pilobolus umbonatus]